MDPIAILFKEYETLRNEIQNRTNNGYQIWGIVAAVLTWLSSRPVDLNFWLLWPTLGAAFGFAAFTIRRDINKAARRIRQIEVEINSIAGADLLKWESQWGSAQTGWIIQRRRSN
jgi:hypothetical protein